jgi:AcrR family transcriptional regulator
MSSRRREIMRMQIARAAMELFTAKGVTATTGDDIAYELGISTRTLWRYFPNKESCVRPLLTGGLDLLAEQLRSWPAHLSLTEHLESTGTLEGDTGAELSSSVVGLIRMTHTEPALMAVWLEVHHTAERIFAEAVAERARVTPGTLNARVQAAAINAALRVAAEQFATGTGRGTSMTALVREALTTVGDGLGPLRESGGESEPHP